MPKYLGRKYHDVHNVLLRDSAKRKEKKNGKRKKRDSKYGEIFTVVESSW